MDISNRFLCLEKVDQSIRSIRILSRLNPKKEEIERGCLPLIYYGSMESEQTEKHDIRLKRVKISDFKRFTELTIEEIPATTRLIMLSGPNGSGKSSFLML